jgi:hypothetical protein
MDPKLTLDDLFPSRFLKAVDLPDEGDLILTIASVETQEIGPDRESRPVVGFNEVVKTLVLNKTNATTISDLYGKIIAGWVGKKIDLYSTEVAFQGKTQLCIRVRACNPHTKKAPAPVQAEPEFSPEENYPDDKVS